jgi:hypothetical protein
VLNPLFAGEPTDISGIGIEIPVLANVSNKAAKEPTLRIETGQRRLHGVTRPHGVDMFGVEKVAVVGHAPDRPPIAIHEFLAEEVGLARVAVVVAPWVVMKLQIRRAQPVGRDLAAPAA